MFRIQFTRLAKSQASYTISEHGKLGVLQLKRPESRNALSLEMGLKILECTHEISKPDSKVRALVLTGEESSFSAGRDLKASLYHSDVEAAEYYNVMLSSVKSLLRVPIPIVVAIERVCLGLGLELALTGDIRVAGTSAQLGFPEINLSLFPGCAGTVLLPLVLGNVSTASDLILTGRRVSGEEAKSMGLVSHIVADGAALDKSMSIAESLISRNRPLLIKTKKILKYNFHHQLTDEWMELSEKERWIVGQSEEHLEALKQFNKKK